MGKKGGVKSSDPEALKEAGNKMFAQNQFEKAVDFYTKALEINDENHIYYANRANAYLEWGKIQECIEDADKAITLKPDFPKSYYRKAKALLISGESEQAIVALDEGIKNAKDKEQLIILREEVEYEIKMDNIIPKDHIERKNFAKFDSYIRGKGAKINKCKARWETTSYRYIVATQDIKRGEDIVAVPYTEWITMEQITEISPLCEKLNTHGDLMEDEKLSYPWRTNFFAIFIIEQRKNPDNQYAEYFRSFPQDVSNYPIMFGDEEHEYLKGSPMLDRIAQRKEIWQKDYDLLCQAEPSVKDIVTFDEFKEGKIIASLRAYDIVYTDGTVRQVLVPYVDMSPINFGREENVKCLQLEGNLRLQASKDITRGEIIVQMKTRACNSSVFLSSGFLAENSRDNNKFQLKASLDESDPLFGVKLQLIEAKEIYQEFSIKEQVTCIETYELISWLRYVVFNEDEAYLMLSKTQAINSAKEKYLVQNKTLDGFESTKGNIFKAREIQGISVQNERLMLKKLQQLCFEHLCKYKTSLKQDQEIIEEDEKNNKLSFNEKNCINLRIGEKIILHSMIELAEKCIPLLQDNMTLKKVRTIVGTSKDYERFQQYIDVAVLALLKQKESGEEAQITKQVNQKLSQSKPQSYK